GHGDSLAQLLLRPQRLLDTLALQEQQVRRQQAVGTPGGHMHRVITLDRLRARLESGDPVTLVEALPPMYYEREHLPGAIKIPHDEVDALAPELLPDRDAEIVVYCASGPCQNSGSAARPLAALGYPDGS